MAKKRGRPEVIPEKVSNEEIARTTEFCKNYQMMMERIEDNRVKERRLEKSIKSAASDFERSLYQQDLDKVREQIRADTEATALFRWGLSQMDARTRSVMEQLYVEGRAWNAVCSEDDYPLAKGSVWNEQQKGVRMLAVLVRNKIQEIS